MNCLSYNKYVFRKCFKFGLRLFNILSLAVGIIGFDHFMPEVFVLVDQKKLAKVNSFNPLQSNPDFLWS